jgi:hypothetical protein
VLAATVAMTTALADRGGGDHGPAGGHGDYGLSRAYTVGLFGDVPYGAPGRAEYAPALADMNDARPAFAIFDGDLKAGGDDACTDELYMQSKAWFNTLRFPVVVTPGDNDWTAAAAATDPAPAASNPEERLAFARESPQPAYRDSRENVRWTAGPVLYVVLNFQGSNDNLPHAGVDGETRSDAEIARQKAEHAARHAATSTGSSSPTPRRGRSAPRASWSPGKPTPTSTTSRSSNRSSTTGSSTSQPSCADRPSRSRARRCSSTATPTTSRSISP